MTGPMQIEKIEQKVLDLSKQFLDNDEAMLAEQLTAEILDIAKTTSEGSAPNEQTLDNARNYIKAQLIRYGGPKECYTAPEICTITSMMVRETRIYQLMAMLR